jgi:DNA-binding transcriptional regulator LsrR (DeoR family)
MPQIVPKETVFRVAQLFFEGHKVTQIRDIVNKEMRPNPGLTRESIYPLLFRAQSYGFVRLVPPLHERLAEGIVKRFGCDRGSIKVVPTPEPRFNQLVAEVAAGLVQELLRGLKKGGQDVVGIGIGPGRASLDFARHLGELLNTEPSLPQINLHAISAGCPTNYPEYASTSFFNLFPRNLVSERYGLFAETMVPTKDYDNIIKRAWLADAFEKRDDISIVVTSMGDMDDPDDLFAAFLEKADYEDREKLREQGWVGNVQYRPYTSTGPVPTDQEPWRSVTLFELADFVSIARTKNKHVVLIARQCARCGRSRAPALRPLLEVPELRVWSEIVMDVVTASDLLGAQA